MSNFTCINCSVRFANANVQREHYKTDWHRYNLKRRVSQLPPVTAEEFSERVLLIKRETENKLEEDQTVTYCNACRKQFSNQKSHDNHLNSKKHKESLLRFEKEHSGENVEITTKQLVKQKPNLAEIVAAEGKGRSAFQQRKTTSSECEEIYVEGSDIDDDDDYEDMETEEVNY